jgi:hypothetical protein
VKPTDPAVSSQWTHLPIQLFSKLHRSHSTTQAGLACDRQLVVSSVIYDVSNHVSQHMRSMVTRAIGNCASLCSDNTLHVPPYSARIVVCNNF